MGSDNLSAIVIGGNFLSINVIAKNSFDLSITVIASQVSFYFVAVNNAEKQKSRKNIFAIRLTKKTSSNTSKIYRNIYRKNLSAIIYRLSISLEEIEIYRLSVSPRAFLKLSIIVIAVVQKGLSCPSLGASQVSFYFVAVNNESNDHLQKKKKNCKKALKCA